MIKLETIDLLILDVSNNPLVIQLTGGLTHTLQPLNTGCGLHRGLP
jgi:hypothetical protein